MKIIEETITPARARAYLRGNSRNRPLSAKHVDYLVAEICSGRWQPNGEAIKFNGDRLLDGQHRLAAVLKAGKSIRSLVIRGLPSDVFHTLDTGKKRSPADTLSVAGEKSSSRVAAALGMVEALSNGWTRCRDRMSGARIVELLAEHPGIRDSVTVYQGPRTLLKPSIAIALHYLFAQRDRPLADKFFADLRSGSGLCEGDPVFALREKLISGSVGNAQLKEEVIVACTIKAWNALRQGVQIRRLYFKPGADALPAIR